MAPMSAITMTMIMAPANNALMELLFEVAGEDVVDAETVPVVEKLKLVSLPSERTVKSGFNASEAFPRYT